MRTLLGWCILFCLLSASASAQGPAIKMTGPMGVQGDAAILGWYPVVLSDADLTLTAPEYASNFLLVTSSVALTATRNLIAPLTPGQQFTVENHTTGAQSITIGGTTGAKITIAPGQTQSVTCDGVNYIQPPSISGVVAPANGGTGGPGTGYAYGNGSSPFTYSPTIPYSALSGAPVTTQFYQSVQVSGSPQTQEPKLNLLPAVAGSVSSATVTAGGVAYAGAPSVAFSGGGCAVEPTGSSTVASGAVTSIVMVTSGSGCTSAPSIVFSGGGGSGAAATALLAPGGISCVDNPLNGSTDCSIPSGGSGSGVPIAQNDVTATRVLGTIYQNTTTGTLYEFGYASTTGGGTGSIMCYDGATSSLGSTPFGGSSTATINSGMASFGCFIPPGYYYEVVASGAVTAIGKWYEDSGFGGGSGAMGYPNAGIANSTGSSWGASYSSTNPIPANFLGALPYVALNPAAAQAITQTGANQFSINTYNSGTNLPVNLTETIHNYGPGYDCGNSGTACTGWSGTRGEVMNYSNSQRGINQAHSLIWDNNAIGDATAEYTYFQPFGGQSAASDEGISLKTLQMHQKGAFTGTVSGSPAVGATSITTTGFGCSYGYCITQSMYDTWADGGIIFDSTKPVSTATVGAGGTSMGGISFPLTVGTVPVSTAWGNIVPASCTNNGNGQWQTYTATTCNVTLGTSPVSPGNFATGTNVCLVGPFKENVAVTAVGTPSAGVQSVTFNTRYAWNGGTALMMQGGDCGDSFVATSQVSSWPIAYFIVGATTSTTLMYANCLGGQCGGGGTLLASGTPITIFPSAEIIGSNGFGGSVDLGTNQMATANGDVLVGAPTSQYLSVGLRVIVGQTTPWVNNASSGIVVQDDGPVPVDYAYYANNNQGATGAPHMMEADGTYNQDFYFLSRPANGGALLFEQGSEPGGSSVAPYFIFLDDGSSGNPGGLKFDPTTGIFSFASAGAGLAPVNAQLFNGVPLTTTGSASNCLSQAGTYVACSSGSVSSFAAPSASWPAWLVPTVTTPTSTPSLAVAASAIPNAALANSTTTVNGVSCALGGTCALPTYCAGFTCASYNQNNPNFPSLWDPLLTANVTPSTLSIPVGSTTGVPAVGCGFMASEYFCWDSVTATDLVLSSVAERGLNGTTAGSWSPADHVSGAILTIAACDTCAQSFATDSSLLVATGTGLNNSSAGALQTKGIYSDGRGLFAAPVTVNAEAKLGGPVMVGTPLLDGSDPCNTVGCLNMGVTSTAGTPLANYSYLRATTTGFIASIDGGAESVMGTTVNGTSCAIGGGCTIATGITTPTTGDFAVTTSTSGVLTTLHRAIAAYAEGDSYTFGTGAAQNYRDGYFGQFLRDTPVSTYANYAVGGTVTEQIGISALANVYYDPNFPIIWVDDGGINDAADDACGGTAGTNCVKNTQLTVDATVAMESIPGTFHIFASNATLVGSWSTPGNFPINNGFGTAQQVASSGATATFSIPSSTSSVVGVTYGAIAANTGTFSISVDGALQTDFCSGTTTFTAEGCGGQAFFNSATVAAFRQQFSVTPNTTHTVVVTTLNANAVPIISVDWIPPSTNANTNPVFYVLAPTVSDAYGYANAAVYNTAISTILTQLKTDGLPVITVDLVSGTPGANSSADYSTTATTACAASTQSGHPNVCGHTAIEQTMLNAAVADGYQVSSFGVNADPSGRMGQMLEPITTVLSSDNGWASVTNRMNMGFGGASPQMASYMDFYEHGSIVLGGFGFDYPEPSSGTPWAGSLTTKTFGTSGWFAFQRDTNPLVTGPSNFSTVGGVDFATGNTSYLGVESRQVGATVASATTISPLHAITHITGTTAIATITPPANYNATFGGCLVMIFDSGLSTTTAGNIFAVYTFSAGQKAQACYDGSKWYF